MRLFLVAFFVPLGSGEVTVVPMSQTVYGDAAKVLMSVGGYSYEPSFVWLSFEPEIAPRCYGVGASPEGVSSSKLLTLWLKEGCEWPAGELRVVRYEDQNVVLESIDVKIADVVRTPTLKRVESVIYLSSTRFLPLDGTNLGGLRKVVFEPPLSEGYDYARTSILGVPTMRLGSGRRWRSDGLPGPLRIVGLDTGAGTRATDVEVAAVQLDPPFENNEDVASVTSKKTKTYASALSIEIDGTSLNPSASKNKFYFASEAPSYALTNVQKRSKLKMTRAKESPWRDDNSPGDLVILAVDPGTGVLVPLGSKGATVASILEDPFVMASTVSLYATATRQLDLVGRGFTSSTRLSFDPTLIVSLDYTMHVTNSTHMTLRLNEGRTWGHSGKTLRVVAIDAGAGYFSDFVAAVVAKIVKDPSDDDDDDDAVAKGFGKESDGLFLIIMSAVAFAAALLGAVLLAGIFSHLKRRTTNTNNPRSTHFEMPVYATVHGRADSFDASLSLPLDDLDDDLPVDNDDDDDPDHTATTRNHLRGGYDPPQRPNVPPSPAAAEHCFVDSDDAVCVAFVEAESVVSKDNEDQDDQEGDTTKLDASRPAAL